MNNKDIRFDFTGVMSKIIGPTHGLEVEEITRWENQCAEILLKMETDHERGVLPFLDLPSYNTRPIKEYVREVTGRFENFVNVGIGGSSLGARALYKALKHPFHTLLSPSSSDGVKLFFADNIDPDLLSGLFEAAPPERTIFNIITKSGSTAETMGTFLIVKDALTRTVGKSWKDHIVITTDPEKGDLRKLARKESLVTFDVPEGVGGRFSVLSPVGLIPACFAGIDIDELLTGAGAMAGRLQKNVLQNPACLSGLIHFLMDTVKNKSISVMMAYSNALYSLADWYRQLWAESLGKKFDLEGREVHAGQTPIKALGATDQHSQIQLYVEGPNDKIITILSVEKFIHTIPFPEDYAEFASLSYFAGHTMNELMDAECLGTLWALRKSKRPAIRVIFPEITPHTVGQFIYAYEFMTVFTGGLYHINPLDQPGVEAGKVAAYTLMGRKGYGEKRQEILKDLETLTEWVL